MSYAASFALQKAVYSALTSDVDLQNIVGTAVFDAVPSGELPEIFVLLGSEKAKDRSDLSGAGSLHELVVSVVAGGSGFSQAKAAAACVHDILHRNDLTLVRGVLVFLAFKKAVARQTSDGGRRVDLTFRARIDDI